MIFIRFKRAAANFSPRYLAMMGLLAAVTLTLTLLESLFSPFLPPGVRVGLANVAVLLSLLIFTSREGLFLTLLKSGFVFLTRGVTAGFMSATGGLLALVITLFLLRPKQKAFISKEPSFLLLSVAGALVHNLGQLLVCCLFTASLAVLWYAPVLLLAAVISGSATGVVVRIILPTLSRNTPTAHETPDRNSDSDL